MTKVCARCVMDETARSIVFDAAGMCNYCTELFERAGPELYKDQGQRDQELASLISGIKSEGKGKRYDCIMGVSGGVDSSFAIHKAVESGLRPLAVHMDNGWNSELAQSNIENLVRRLQLDLVTYVIDWREYRALMQAFLDADVIDVELLYDNAMYAVNFQQARRWQTRWILAGTNLSTEGMRIPSGWNWLKYDKRNIKGIKKAYDGKGIDSFPAIGTLGYTRSLFLRRIRWVSFLDYFDYNKNAALSLLQKHYSFKPYPHKHYESVFTRLYMGNILPTKFNVDMRKVDFSNLILSQQMDRQQALALLREQPYPSTSSLERDILFFQKKMGWTDEEWRTYLDRPERPHDAFPSEKGLYDLLRSLSRKFRPASDYK